MGRLFPGGTEPTSGSEFRSRVIFRLMWWLMANTQPSPLAGEGGSRLLARDGRGGWWLRVLLPAAPSPVTHFVSDSLPRER